MFSVCFILYYSSDEKEIICHHSIVFVEIIKATLQMEHLRLTFQLSSEIIGATIVEREREGERERERERCRKLLTV